MENCDEKLKTVVKSHKENLFLEMLPKMLYCIKLLIANKDIFNDLTSQKSNTYKDKSNS